MISLYPYHIMTWILSRNREKPCPQSLPHASCLSRTTGWKVFLYALRAPPARSLILRRSSSISSPQEFATRSEKTFRKFLLFFLTASLITGCGVIEIEKLDVLDIDKSTPNLFSQIDVIVEMDSENNEILDLEGLLFAVSAPPGHGSLENSGGVLLYTPLPDYTGDDSAKIYVKDAGDVEEITFKIRIVDPDQPVVANDPQSGWHHEDIFSPYAWIYRTDCSDILMAVIDTGIDYGHQDLSANIWKNPGESGPDGEGSPKESNGIDDDGNGLIDDHQGWDFSANDNDPSDENNHGTHVAGIMGAVGNNGTGITGICWKASLVAIRVLDSGGSGPMSDIIEGIYYANKIGAKVTNNSYGFEASCTPGQFEACINNNFPLLRDAVKDTGDKGNIFAVAAGNDGFNNNEHLYLPANFAMFFDNVISVAASGENGYLAGFSNYGNESVKIAAPGVSIISTIRNNGYSSFNGTSMASPMIAGAAALVWSMDTGASYPVVIDAILNNVNQTDFHDGDKIKSGGKLYLQSAIREML